MDNCNTTGLILIQILTGFVGSLLAGALIAGISEKRFNRAIKATESSIINSVEPLNRTTLVIAKEIKTLAQVVDKLREGLEGKI